MNNKKQTTSIVLGFPDYINQAEQFAEALNLPCQSVDIHHFPDGESKIQLPEQLPDQVVLFYSLDRPNAKLIKLILAASGARTMGTKQIALVAPYLCYMRQDKAFHKGEVISQQVIGRLLASYFDKVLTVDAHLHRVHNLSEAIPVAAAINITATDAMAQYINQHIDHPYLLGPDGESEQWVSDIAVRYQMDYGVATKERYGDRNVKVNIPAGPYQGRNIVLVDDVASTGKTLLEAAKALAEYQPASISVLVTHALFVDDAMEQLTQAGVTNIWSCDSINHSTNVVKLAQSLADNFTQEN